MIVYLLCETSVNHPTCFVEASQKSKSRRAEQQNNWPKWSKGNGYIRDLLSEARLVANPEYTILLVVKTCFLPV